MQKNLCFIELDLDWDEELLISTYSVNPARIDYTSPTVQFNVAAQVIHTYLLQLYVISCFFVSKTTKLMVR